VANLGTLEESLYPATVRNKERVRESPLRVDDLIDQDPPIDAPANKVDGVERGVMQRAKMVGQEGNGGSGRIHQLKRRQLTPLPKGGRVGWSLDDDAGGLVNASPTESDQDRGLVLLSGVNQRGQGEQSRLLQLDPPQVLDLISEEGIEDQPSVTRHNEVRSDAAMSLRMR
jgi:hypothetical protein